MINAPEGVNVTQIRSLLTFCLGISYLGNLFLNSSFIDNVNVVLIVLVIALSFTVVSGVAKVIGYATFTLSSVLLLSSHAPLSVWQEALQENMFLIVMFIMVPLLSIPIQHGGYINALQDIFQRHVSTDSRYYFLVSFFTAFLSVLVSVASINLVYEIGRASGHSENKKILSSALTRGFNTSLIWAPTAAGVALIVQLTKVEWLRLFPYGLFFGVLAGVVGYILTRLEERKGKSPGSTAMECMAPAERTRPQKRMRPQKHTEGNHVSKVVELSVFGFILIAGIAAISSLTGLSTIIVVAYVSLVYPVIWLGILKRLPVLITEFKGEYFKHRLPMLKNELVLFVGAGLLANSINYSHLGDYVPKILSLVVGDSTLLLTIAIMGITVLFAGLGIHSIVTVTILGGTIQAANYGISPIYLALVLAISWALGNAISPSAANVIGVSGLVGESPVQVGIRWNGLCVLIMGVVFIPLLMLLNTVGLL